MDQYITVRRQVSPQTVDSAGAPVDEFEDWLNLWADVLDKSSRLFRQGEAPMSEADYAMTVYDHHAIENGMRVAWGGAEYQVVDYLRNGSGEYGRILVKSLTR